MGWDGGMLLFGNSGGEDGEGEGGAGRGGTVEMGSLARAVGDAVGGLSSI